MRKTFLLVAACLLCVLANAQIFNVESVEKLPAASYQDARVAGISPDGSYVLMTTGGENGLWRYDLANDKLSLVSNAPGAGFNVQVSRNGNEVVYSEMVIKADRSVANNIYRANLTQNTFAQVAKEQADFAQLTFAEENVQLINEDCQVYLIKNGKKIHIAPQGEEYTYIWQSLSPNGKKILYYVSELGCYVCDLNGKNSQFIGYDCRAPRWYDNNTIVGMYDIDDDHFTVSSRIVAYTLDGKYQILTSPEMIAMYPFATEGKIVFSTIDSKTYIINVNK
jgi:Tol biopolymer transport system component